MCARRFLTIIVLLTLIAVAVAFAIFQFGGGVLKKQMAPQGHFVAPPRQTGPDYADPASWIARPGMTGNPAEWRPDGLSEANRPRRAAAFFIHPTTYLQRDRWNAPLDDRDSGERAALFVRSQASAFNAVADVWAPRYRQAAFGAFLLKGSDAQAALDLAYADVLRAFDRFVAAIPADRPIILAGHSQGALHLSRLLRERVAARPLARRIVAAYVVGWPLSTAADLPALGLPPCRAPGERGCVLSWLSFREPANPSLILDSYDGSVAPNGVKRRRGDMLCTNPISGTSGGAAEPGDNSGTLIPSADLLTARLEGGRVGARCEGGLLILTGDVPALGPYVLPGNNYHVYDYALFWGAIRRDAARRLAANR